MRRISLPFSPSLPLSVCVCVGERDVQVIILLSMRLPHACGVSLAARVRLYSNSIRQQLLNKCGVLAAALRAFLLRIFKNCLLFQLLFQLLFEPLFELLLLFALTNRETDTRALCSRTLARTFARSLQFHFVAKPLGALSSFLLSDDC